jgi:hypothetical protein
MRSEAKQGGNAELANKATTCLFVNHQHF